MKRLINKVIQRVQPCDEEKEEVKRVSEEIIRRLEEKAREEGVEVEVVLGGSASRGTFMKSDYDLDFFMRFENEKSIREYYKRIIKPLFKNVELVHGTRDYYKFEYKNFEVEIVPSLKLSKPEEAENSADISYFHINYLKEKFEENPELKKQVLVLKQFLKANNVYGAESARGGFSGYVSELLIIHFKKFQKLIEFFEESEPKVVIDIEDHYDGEEEVLEGLNKHKIRGPLVIVDPLLKDRNAAASLDYSSFSEFLFRIRYLIREPMMKLFNIRGLKMNLVKERSERRGSKLISYKIKETRTNFSVTKAKVLKRLKRLVKDLEREGWDVYNHGITDDKMLFVELETLKVSKAKKHYGPRVWTDSENFTKFFNKWKNNQLGEPYVHDKRLVVDVYRKQNVKEEIREGLKDYIC